MLVPSGVRLGAVISRSRPLLLGSASPRRSSLLAHLGLPFVVLPADIVEDAEPGERPHAYLERIAGAKLAAVQARLASAGRLPDAPHGVAGILVADTTVVIDDSIVGKPADVADAVSTLNRLVGRTHTVLTRYLVARVPAAPGVAAEVQRTVETLVTLRAASAEEVLGYARSGEGLDKAGAYAAQGLGAFLVEAVSGSYTNVVGLPLCELVSDLKQVGLLGAFPADLAAFDTPPSGEG
ncbi:MAG: Maf-like protein [Pseudomonadota bacterium]